MAIQSSKSEKTSRRRLFSHLQAYLWRTGFFECGEEWYHYQQQLMVSKMIVKLFS